MTGRSRLPLLVTLAIVVAAAAAAGTDARLAAVPRPLHGLPLTGKTGLQLLVADDPPLLLDLDDSRVTPIRGIPTADKPVLSVSAVGDNTVVWVDHLHPGRTVPRAQIYLIRHGSTRATLIAGGWWVAADRDGRALWILRHVGAHRCVLAETTLAGRTIRPARPVPCSVELVDSGNGAVLVDGDRATDPATGKTLPRGSRLWAISGDDALSSDEAHTALTLTDLRTGSSRQLPWPSRIGDPDQAVVDPRSGLIALDFANPAYGGSGTQVTDAFLLDPHTGRFTHLPDMPAAVHLKFTSMDWTRDGRLVTLAGPSGGAAGRSLVAVWKPGWKQLRLRPVALPARRSGSDSFTIASQ